MQSRRPGVLPEALGRGKVKKVAIVACMHKLLRILNAMVRDQQPFHA